MQKAYFKYIIALLLFGSNGIVASHISLSSYEIVLFRTLIGSILLIAIFFISHQKLSFYKNRRDFAFLALSGIAMGACWMFLYEAYKQIGVSIATLAYNCGPVIVMILSPLLFKEKLTWPKIVGFVAVMGGVFLVNGNAMSNGMSIWGIFCGLMSAVAYSVMVISNKKAESITGLQNSMLQLIIGFITVGTFVVCKQGFSFNVASSDWIPILILGLVNTGVGCWFYFSSIGYLPVQTVAICGYLELLSAVVLSVVLLGETMLPLQIIGALLIVGGAVFGELASRKMSKKAAIISEEN